MLKNNSKYKIRIGRNPSDGSFFHEEKKAIIIPIQIKGVYETKDLESFERILFMTGCKYEKQTERSILYIIECNTYKQLKNLKPEIERAYKIRDIDLEIEIGKECKEFLRND